MNGGLMIFLLVVAGLASIAGIMMLANPRRKREPDDKPWDHGDPGPYYERDPKSR
jgi:hypothetical protein